jgi:hypothetical protein
MTDFRSLCAELVAWAEKTSAHYYQSPDVLIRARAVLARWGNHPAIPDSSHQPTPVTERPPGPEDCDAQERCWQLIPYWLMPPTEQTPWLPYDALPLPSKEVE